MRGAFFQGCAVAVLLFSGFPPAVSAGKEPPVFDSISVRIGGGYSDREDIKFLPVMASVGLRLPDFVDRPLSSIDLRLEWVVEAWVAPIWGLQTTAEVGVNPVSFRLAWDRGQDLVPFGEVGIGILYTGLRDIGTGGGFQFDQVAGLGLEWFVRNGVAVTLSYRYRHMSNSGIYDRNRGLDTHYGLLGVTWNPGRLAE